MLRAPSSLPWRCGEAGCAIKPRSALFRYTHECSHTHHTHIRLPCAQTFQHTHTYTQVFSQTPPFIPRPLGRPSYRPPPPTSLLMQMHFSGPRAHRPRCVHTQAHTYCCTLVQTLGTLIPAPPLLALICPHTSQLLYSLLPSLTDTRSQTHMPTEAQTHEDASHLPMRHPHSPRDPFLNPALGSRGPGSAKMSGLRLALPALIRALPSSFHKHPFVMECFLWASSACNRLKVSGHLSPGSVPGCAGKWTFR